MWAAPSCNPARACTRDFADSVVAPLRLASAPAASIITSHVNFPNLGQTCSRPRR